MGAMSGLFDVAIVGAGPVGLAAVIACKRAGLSYVVLEKGCVVNAIFDYPTYMGFFTTAPELEIGNHPMVTGHDKPDRKDALMYYRLVAQRLAARDSSGVFLRLLPDGRAAVELLHEGTGTRVKLVPERTYGTGGALRSISYQQRPDVAVEVTAPAEPTRIYLFDPKYKLDGEPVNGDGSDGKPRKGDIDKMHAYRDAIRDPAGERVVRSAVAPRRNCACWSCCSSPGGMPPALSAASWSTATT